MCQRLSFYFYMWKQIYAMKKYIAFLVIKYDKLFDILRFCNFCFHSWHKLSDTILNIFLILWTETLTLLLFLTFYVSKTIFCFLKSFKTYHLMFSVVTIVCCAAIPKCSWCFWPFCCLSFQWCDEVIRHMYVFYRSEISMDFFYCLGVLTEDMGPYPRLLGIYDLRRVFRIISEA